MYREAKWCGSQRRVRVKFSNRFAALEKFDDDDDDDDFYVDINRAWESIREYLKILATKILSYYELK
jgi:hypothetical protein